MARLLRRGLSRSCLRAAFKSRLPLWSLTTGFCGTSASWLCDRQVQRINTCVPRVCDRVTALLCRTANKVCPRVVREHARARLPVPSTVPHGEGSTVERNLSRMAKISRESIVPYRSSGNTRREREGEGLRGHSEYSWHAWTVRVYFSGSCRAYNARGENCCYSDYSGFPMISENRKRSGRVTREIPAIRRRRITETLAVCSRRVKM